MKGMKYRLGRDMVVALGKNKDMKQSLELVLSHLDRMDGQFFRFMPPEWYVILAGIKTGLFHEELWPWPDREDRGVIPL